MMNETKNSALIQCLAIYDEVEGDLRGLIGVDCRGHAFFEDVKALFECSSIDWLDLGDGLWLYGAGNSLVAGKSFNVPAMILASASGRGQVIYGPVVLASLDGDLHVSLTGAHEHRVLTAMKSIPSLGTAGTYNKMVEILAGRPDFDEQLTVLESWMGTRLGIDNFSAEDYR